jgi:intein/homing endonuclease
MGQRYVFDSEATDLLNSNSVDYTASPYVLKPDFRIHSMGFLDVDNGEYHEFVGKDVYKRVPEFVMDCADELISHNGINYDHMVMKAALGLDFEIGVREGYKTEQFYDRYLDTINGKPITITDTLVLSKTLNPDRTMHSIDYFGKMMGLEKIDWRAKAIELGLIPHDAPKGAEFKTFHPEMLVYMRRDIELGKKVWQFLLKEWGKWDWKEAYELEKAVAEIIVRQEHRGFWFDREKALENVRELDVKMEELRKVVEPLIPPKPLTKGAQKDYIPPKIQFKKNGEPSALMHKWVAKHGGTLLLDRDLNHYTELYGKAYYLPMPLEPILTHGPAKINDTTHIKGWLVDLGWKPSAYKERDLTVDSKKKKLEPDQFLAAVNRYVEQTLNSPFKADRLEHLECTEGNLLGKLSAWDMKRPLKVLTNPTLTVGVEKEIDPRLLDLKDKFAYAKEVSEYLTYSHRRNSILGGGVDPDDVEDDDEYAGKGWLSVDRILEDHRIPTPADTCGAGTSRFKHRLVANIPRVTSLYGDKMRALFGVDVAAGFVQLGYDFDSLEAKIEGHYTWKYDDEHKSYVNSLTAAKPNDVHTVTAAKIAATIGQPFTRAPAKNVKYACSYGARPARVAKTVGCSLELGEKIFNAFWDAAKPLALLTEAVKKHWEDNGKKYIIGIDGRKVPTRSASALINSLFQSGGVICAKKAMVLHDRKLRAENLVVDFWTQDWRNSSFCQQLIAYHDESQLEVERSMVKWKKFASEEECKAFESDDGKVWSDPYHNEKGWFRGYCRAGELATIAVREAGEHFGLNVELSAGYMLGTSWASCH